MVAFTMGKVVVISAVSGDDTKFFAQTPWKNDPTLELSFPYLVLVHGIIFSYLNKRF